MSNKESKSEQELENMISTRLTKAELKDLRASRFTQKELSVDTGLSIQCISDIESTTSGNPTLRSLIKYLDALGYEMVFQKKTL